MSAAAAASSSPIAKECIWPHEIALISKPRIPPLAICDEPYSSMGASNDTTGSRLNCCWIESTLHFLLADPYMRYFAADWSLKSTLEHTTRRPVPASQLERYNQGYLLMDILALRYLKRDDVDQSRFDDIMKIYLSELREYVPVEYHGQGSRKGMGDIATLMAVALPALRFFIAMHWSGHPVQRHYLANGLNPLIHFYQRCPNQLAQCPLHQQELIGYDIAGSALEKKEMALNTDAIVINFERDVEAIDLREWCAEHFTTKWQLAETTMCKDGVCRSRRLEKRSLATLPWMLYINKAVDGKIPVLYDPEKLIVGPTADDKYAAYKLIARDIFAYSHFSADIRIKGRLFANFSFEQKKEFIIPDGMYADRFCSFMVWQRIE